MATKQLLGSTQALCLASYGYVYRLRGREVNMGSGEKNIFFKRNLKVYNDRNLKDKLWYKVCESAVTNWRQLPVSYETCQATLTQDLNMRRVAEKFVPRILTAEQNKWRLSVATNMLQEVVT